MRHSPSFGAAARIARYGASPAAGVDASGGPADRELDFYDGIDRASGRRIEKDFAAGPRKLEAVAFDPRPDRAERKMAAPCRASPHERCHRLDCWKLQRPELQP